MKYINRSIYQCINVSTDGMDQGMAALTLFEKVWNSHVVADLGDGFSLLHVDRHLLHDLGGPRGLREIRERGLRVRNPELTFATPDHAISSAKNREGTSEIGSTLLAGLREATKAAGVKLFDLGQPGQGIVHVIGPELGLTVPGALVVCGDSHTCTHGGLGAIAFGIGSTELVHVLATQTIVQRRPKLLRARFDGGLPAGVTPKDLILHLIGTIGAAGGSGYAVEYAGPTIEAMEIEGRLTVCNLSIELGAKVGMVAPDDKTFAYLRDRPYSPKGEAWALAQKAWEGLKSDPGAKFDREVDIEVSKLQPQITWGTSPQHVIGVNELIPSPSSAATPGDAKAMQDALDYMGLAPNKAVAGLPIDYVFIGSCTNSRLSDLRAAASVAKGRKVADTVRAWVVPGSESVKRAAEAEGLDRIFEEAGFDWREAGCSMCLAANGETVAPGKRSVSTSNRNFVGRQGPNARTHLASPAMAAAAALAGRIVDVRELGVQ
jgi:3-isopropylmalate/(R)-2-methylmalate dehydratase large subunit